MIEGLLEVIGAIAIVVAVICVIAYFVDEHEKVEHCEWIIEREKEDILELFKITKDLYEKLEKTDENA